ncbi:putative protein phosphatase 2A regulatory subunit [Trypanosoma vivax]|nr:putative protein phosphatase 2A regulatory subunit [Trypanosoma vivax]
MACSAPGIGSSSEGCMPGCFSPRPSHSRNFSTADGLSFCDSAATNTVVTEGNNGQAISTSFDSLEDMESMPDARSVVPVAEPAPTPCRYFPSTEGHSRRKDVSTLFLAGCSLEHSDVNPRHSPPGVTLLEHQRVRYCAGSIMQGLTVSSPSQARGCSHSISSQSFLNPSAVCSHFSLCGAYACGKPWKDVASMYRGTSRSGVWTVTALASSSSGDHVAIGDRAGRLFVMSRSELPSCSVDGAPEDKMGLHAPRGQCSFSIRQPYGFVVGRQAYSSVIDPLNSVEVTPNIQAVCFLPQMGPTTFLLAANEKLPRLYKVMQVQESPSPFSAVDHIGQERPLKLTLRPPNGTTRTVMKQVARYALSHEYNINSISPRADDSQFFSADDLTVKLWCVEYPDTSIETYSLKPTFDEEAHETISCIQSFPHEPFLLFVVSLCGAVRIVDTRQSLKWLHQAPLTLRSTIYEDNAIMASTILECALSPCGMYVVGREAASMCLWDVRRAAARGSHASRSGHVVSGSLSSCTHDEECDVVQRWEVHPHVRREMEQFFHTNTLERISVRFLNRREVCTGGFSNSLHVVDIHDSSSAVGATGCPDSSCSKGKTVKLPELRGAREVPCGALQVCTNGALSLPAIEGESEGDGPLSCTVTKLSTPLISSNGDCCLLASCGSSVFQVAYTNCPN